LIDDDDDDDDDDSSMALRYVIITIDLWIHNI